MELATKSPLRPNLSGELAQFTGTTKYYRSPVLPGIYWTDGVNHYSHIDKEQGEGSTSLHITLILKEAVTLNLNGAPFISIDVTVDGGETIARFSDGDLNELGRLELVSSPSVPDGEYGFFFYDNVLMLKTEY